jgi:hypothetical protein
MTTTYKNGAVAIALAAGLLTGLPANADITLVGYVDGNDCSGVYGTSPNCTAFDPINEDAPAFEPTPQIVKFEVDQTNNTFTEDGINPIFPSIDGSEFEFTNLGDEAKTGTWTYTPDANDPVITAFALKSGNGFWLYAVTGGETTFSWSISKGLSHITFYDGAAVVPIPAAAVLFGSALLGVAGIGFRRRQSKTAPA